MRNRRDLLQGPLRFLLIFAALSIFFAVVSMTAEFQAKQERDRAVAAEQAALAAARAEAEQRAEAEFS